MCLETQDSNMSADRKEPMGLRHMTVVPENFETNVERDGDDERVDE